MIDSKIITILKIICNIREKMIYMFRMPQRYLKSFNEILFSIFFYITKCSYLSVKRFN
jgi:hypothetical protein